jgi:MFS family permease
MTRTARILIAASFLGFMSLGLFGPIYAIFVQKIGGDVLEAGVAYGIFSIVSGLFVFFVGRRDFFKKRLRQMAVLGYVLFTVGNAGYLVIQNPTQLFFVQIILGIAGGILEPSWDGLFSANLTEERAAHFWATWAGMQNIATGIGALAGGILVAVYSFRVLFLVILVLNIIATAIAFRVLKADNV